MTRRAHFTRARAERKRHEDRPSGPAAKCVRVRDHARVRACVRVGAPREAGSQAGWRRNGATGEKEREYKLSRFLGKLPKNLLPQKYLITELPVV